MSIEGAFPKFPITIPSRCSPRLFCTDYARPKYTFDMSSRPCGSAIQFQLTYTSDRATYSPCYFPVIPCCHLPEESGKVTRLKWIDCTGNPVSKCYNNYTPIPFRCPSYGCLPPEPRLPRCCFPPSCPPLTCRPRPERSPPPPTICIAGPCRQPLDSKSYCPPKSAPKILPPSSNVRFCIRYTNEGSRYYPCYYSDLPKCPNNLC